MAELFIHPQAVEALMEPITIRQAALSDLVVVTQIARETFQETFTTGNTEADMQHYLAQHFSEAKLTAELSNPDSLFFIAWQADSSIGYLKVNIGQAQTELQDPAGLEIERIYVKSRYHGQRVGQLLYEKAFTVAQQQQKIYLWLGVWEENLRAIRFYQKNGFMAFDKHIFRVGQDEQIDVMMKKMVSQGAD